MAGDAKGQLSNAGLLLDQLGSMFDEVRRVGIGNRVCFSWCA